MEGDDENPTLADKAAHRKHLALLDRLSKRRPSTAASDPTVTASADPVAAFSSRFADSKRVIEADLSRLRAAGASSSSAAELTSAADAIAALDRLVAENSYILPPYEVRAAFQSIAEMRESLELANSELIPKKRFSFRNKAKPSGPGESGTANARSSAVNDATAVAVAAPIREAMGFQGHKGATLVKEISNLDCGTGDFTLADLDHCEVHIRGRLRALFVHHLSHCRVLTGPVLGSIHIENVTDCVFVVASHQIRIHEARTSDFYLRVRSHPIIEDCNGVRFAPYALTYPGLEEELRESGLDQESGHWANVDDFKWLRTTQSPNWRLIPEEERIETIDILKGDM